MAQLQLAMTCGAAVGVSIAAALTLDMPTVDLSKVKTLLPEIFHKDALIECGEALTRRPAHEARHVAEPGACPFSKLDAASGGRLQAARSQCPNWTRMRSSAPPPEP